MIISEIFYGVRCNRCEEVYEDGEHSFWTDEGSAIEYATEADWQEEKGKHYCPNCYETNVDDEIIVLEEYPEHLKVLNRFIEKVVFGQKDVFETNSEFTVKCRIYRNPRFNDFEEAFVKQLLGEKLISLEYTEGKYNNFICTIKFQKKTQNS